MFILAKLKINNLVAYNCFVFIVLPFCCSKGKYFVHHIGLVANFTDNNGCLPQECPITGKRVSTGETQYYCPGCRHRWRWLDGSQATSYHRWGSDQPWLYAVAHAHCVVSRNDDWLSVECGNVNGYHICKQGTHTRMTSSAFLRASFV